MAGEVAGAQGLTPLATLARANQRFLVDLGAEHGDGVGDTCGDGLSAVRRHRDGRGRAGAGAAAPGDAAYWQIASLPSSTQRCGTSWAEQS